MNQRKREKKVRLPQALTKMLGFYILGESRVGHMSQQMSQRGRFSEENL